MDRVTAALGLQCDVVHGQALLRSRKDAASLRCDAGDVGSAVGRPNPQHIRPERDSVGVGAVERGCEHDDTARGAEIAEVEGSPHDADDFPSHGWTGRRSRFSWNTGLKLWKLKSITRHSSPASAISSAVRTWLSSESCITYARICFIC